MPLYEFECECGERFEALVAVGELAPCPVCGRAETRRVYSAPAIAGRRLQVTGSDARRSDADRRVVQEGRQERLTETKAARARGEKPAGAKRRSLPKGWWA